MKIKYPMKQRYRDFILTFDENRKVIRREDFKSINAAKKANRGNMAPGLKDLS